MYHDRHDPPTIVVDAPGHEEKFHDAESLLLSAGTVVAGCQPPQPVVRHGTTTTQTQNFNAELEFTSILKKNLPYSECPGLFCTFARS